MTLAELIHKPIRNTDEAHSFLSGLFKLKKLFHPDASAETIYSYSSKCKERIFSDLEASLVNARMDEVFKFVDDPYQVCLELMGE